MRGPPHWHENWNLSKWKSKYSKLKSKKKSKCFFWKFSKSITIRYTSVKWKLRFVEIKIIKIEIKKISDFFLKIWIFFLSVRNVEGQNGEIFSKIFFLIFFFRMTQFAKKSKNKILKILIFFLSLRNVGDFDLFDPWRENQSFFWYGVFAKC